MLKKLICKTNKTLYYSWSNTTRLWLCTWLKMWSMWTLCHFIVLLQWEWSTTCLRIIR